MRAALRVWLGGALCLLACCRAREDQAFLQARDHAVYSAVLREQLTWPQEGEHGRGCTFYDSNGRVAVVGTTQPLPPGTPSRDAGWAKLLPARAAPLMAALRALDREPALAIDPKRLAAGAPIELVPEPLAARTLWPKEQITMSSGQNAPLLFWFSRVAYTADGDWALVYAAQVCPGITPAMVHEAEGGAYEAVFLAALQRRSGSWIVHKDPLFLDIALPRVRGGRVKDSFPPPAR